MVVSVSAASLPEDGRLIPSVPEPPGREARYHFCMTKRLQRRADRRTQLRPLLEDSAVALVRGDLPCDRAIQIRLVALGRDKDLEVGDHRLAVGVGERTQRVDRRGE